MLFTHPSRSQQLIALVLFSDLRQVEWNADTTSHEQQASTEPALWDHSAGNGGSVLLFSGELTGSDFQLNPAAALLFAYLTSALKVHFGHLTLKEFPLP